MARIVRLSSFVAGPEPEGRGFKLLSQFGSLGTGGWQGNFPLVLLEWAKLRSPSGFCGRFTVAGGAIAVRAAYFGEGSAGPIARANGVFIDDDVLATIIASECELFAALPPPSEGNEFGARPLTVTLADGRPAENWPGLGLAWKDRQIFVCADLPLEAVAVTALESIDPPEMRMRIGGWCTTGHLAARGDFLPIQNCGLLVTRTDEPLADDRFLPAEISQSPEFVGASVDPPNNYRLWEMLRSVSARRPSEIGTAMVWTPAMADWTVEALSWRYVELLSQHQVAYANVVHDIAGIASFGLNGCEKAAIVTAQRYLKEVAAYDRVVLPRLVKEFQQASAKQGFSGEALDSTILDLLDWSLAEELDLKCLSRVAGLLQKRVKTDPSSDDVVKFNLLEKALLWRWYVKEKTPPVSIDQQCWQRLWTIRRNLNLATKEPEPVGNRGQLYLQARLLRELRSIQSTL